MNSLYLVGSIPAEGNNIIPSFSELREKPKDSLELIWLLTIFFILFSFYVGKDVVLSLNKRANDRINAQLEEEKAIREERENRINFLENEVKQLYRERIFLMKASGINSDFLKSEVKNVSEKSTISNS